MKAFNLIISLLCMLSAFSQSGSPTSAESLSRDGFTLVDIENEDYWYVQAKDVATFSTSTQGTISGLLDDFGFGISSGRADVVQISGSIYAVVFRGIDNDEFLRTFSVDSDGNVVVWNIDEFEFDANSASLPQIINISGDIYAITYSDANSDGILITVNIDSSGAISGSTIDSLEFDTTQGKYPKIINVSGDIYAIAYAGSGNDGMLITVDINSTGAIENSVVNSFEFQTTEGGFPYIISIVGNVYAITYEGPNDDIYVSSFQIESDGSINTTIVDTYNLAASNSFF
jgi:hypothetical protein